MLVTLGWLVLASLPQPRPTTIDSTPSTVHRPSSGRVTVWSDRDVPYRRGESARVYISVDEPSYVTVFRVDTDGRLRVLFPREPWTDTYVRIQGDPYVRLTDLAARIAPDGDYDYDIAPYYVDRRYDYPRFVCYDCHAYA